MEFKSELKQQWGKFTDEDMQQIEGFLDRFIVKVQERYGYGDEKRELMQWADVWHQNGAGSHRANAALTRGHQGERDGSPSNFTLSVKEMKP